MGGGGGEGEVKKRALDKRQENKTTEASFSTLDVVMPPVLYKAKKKHE